MQSFLVGLLLAGISATSFIAFKHPYGYTKLFPYLMATATILFAGITVWYIAVELTWRNIEPFLNSEWFIAARSAKSALKLPYFTVALWYFGIVAFFWVNLRLPPFLQVADDDHNGAGANGNE